MRTVRNIIGGIIGALILRELVGITRMLIELSQRKKSRKSEIGSANLAEPFTVDLGNGLGEIILEWS